MQFTGEDGEDDGAMPPSEDMLRPPKDSNVLAVSKAMPRAMKRSMWSVSDYQLSRRWGRLGSVGVGWSRLGSVGIGWGQVGSAGCCLGAACRAFSSYYPVSIFYCLFSILLRCCIPGCPCTPISGRVGPHYLAHGQHSLAHICSAAACKPSAAV